MSSNPLQLEGRVQRPRPQAAEINPEQIIADQEREIERLQVQVRSLSLTIAAVRRVFEPWHTALGAVWGEIELLSISEVESGSPGQTRANPKWDSYKKSMPGRPAELIDLLLLHGQMKTKQIMAAMHCAKDTVYNTAYKLNNAGLLKLSQGTYSLKEL